MSKKDLIDEFYYMAMYDLAHEVTKQDLRVLMLEYQRKEMYEQCAGIKRALDTYTFIGDYYRIRDEQNKGDLIQINFDKDED